MGYSLRPYQQEAVNSVWKYIREKDTNPCIVLPTGTGKSLVIAQIVKDVVQKWNGRVLVLAHVKELLEQNAEKIQSLIPEIPVGIFSSGLKRKDKKQSVIVAGIQSIYKHATEFDPFDIIIVDEAHLITTDSDGCYTQFLNDEKVVNPKVRVIGMTATPYRLKGGMICKPDNILNEICYEAGLKEMINGGYLSPIIPKMPVSNPDFSGLKKIGGDFVVDDIEQIMNKNSVVNDACREIVEQTQDRKSVIIFCTSVSHCNNVKKTLESMTGEEVGMVTGSTPSEERAELLERFKGKTIKSGLFAEEKKPLKYLANVSVLTTGFDAPNVDCVAMLRPTASPGLLVQIAGRGLRLSPSTGKVNCKFLDFGENIMRHGPLDAIRVKEKTGTGNGVCPTKRCPQCGTITEAMRAVCPECGFEFPKPEATHDGFASEDGLLSGQFEDTEYDVKDEIIRVWEKKGADENTPKTVCVEYTISGGKQFREWYCPEHTGYALKKFFTWWNNVYYNDDGVIPDTAEQVYELFTQGFIKKANKITVRHTAGEKFDRIINCEYSDSCIVMGVPDYNNNIFEDEDDIPF